MLNEGPIPRFLHGAIEYAAGIVFIAAPFALNFDTAIATGISIVVGVLVLFVAASSEGPTGLTNQISLTVHVAFDFALALFLIAAPFVFDFSDKSKPTVFFIGIGLAHMLITIGTRFRPSETTRSP